MNCRLRGFFALVLLAVWGCGPAGPKTYPLSGVVRFDGEPVERGYISLVPHDTSARSSASKIEHGHFRLRASAGKNRVEITATRDAGPVDPVMGQAPQEQYIPDQYNVESRLGVNVTAKDNQLNFDLQANKG